MSFRQVDADEGIELDTGEKQTGSLFFDTSGIPAGEYTVRLESNDDSQDLSVLVGGIPDSVVDNFEEALYEDLGNTLSDYYGGDLSVFTRQQSTVYEGSYALEGDASGSNFISRTDVSAGGSDTISGWMRFGPNVSQDHGLVVCTQDPDSTPEGYFLAYSPGNSEMEIFRLPNFTSVSGTTTVSISSGSWFKQEISGFSTGDLVYTIYDNTGTQLGQVSGSDSTYASGGIGFRAADGVSQYDLVEAQ